MSIAESYRSISDDDDLSALLLNKKEQEKDNAHNTHHKQYSKHVELTSIQSLGKEVSNPEIKAKLVSKQRIPSSILKINHKNDSRKTSSVSNPSLSRETKSNHSAKRQKRGQRVNMQVPMSIGVREQELAMPSTNFVNEVN